MFLPNPCILTVAQSLLVEVDGFTDGIESKISPFAFVLGVELPLHLGFLLRSKMRALYWFWLIALLHKGSKSRGLQYNVRAMMVDMWVCFPIRV